MTASFLDSSFVVCCVLFLPGRIREGSLSFGNGTLGNFWVTNSYVCGVFDNNCRLSFFRKLDTLSRERDKYTTITVVGRSDRIDYNRESERTSWPEELSVGQ